MHVNKSSAAALIGFIKIACFKKKGHFAKTGRRKMKIYGCSRILGYIYEAHLCLQFRFSQLSSDDVCFLNKWCGKKTLKGKESIKHTVAEEALGCSKGYSSEYRSVYILKGHFEWRWKLGLNEWRIKLKEVCFMHFKQIENPGLAQEPLLCFRSFKKVK